MNNFSNSKQNPGRFGTSFPHKNSMLAKALKNLKLSKIILMLFLLLLIAVGAIPGYLKGQWQWQQQIQVKNLGELKKVQDAGITLPGWQTVSQKTVPIGGHKWSFQPIQKDDQTQAILLLRPMRDRKDQPQVEWVDLSSFQWRQTSQPRKWQTDQYKTVEFSANPSENGGKSFKVQANFFRKWLSDPAFSGTFAVLQWYAWPGGGNPSPSSWFWADQITQWQGVRLPWVAVSIIIPIEPLGDAQTAWPLAEDLGRTVQNTLMAGALKTS